MKVFIAIDQFDPRFCGFYDFNNDEDFIHFVLAMFPVQVGDILSHIYCDGVYPSYHAGVTAYHFDDDVLPNTSYTITRRIAKDVLEIPNGSWD